MKIKAVSLMGIMLTLPLAAKAQHKINWKSAALDAGFIGAAAFDAYTTRQANQMPGVVEHDPAIRPFVHSAAVYPATECDEVLPMIGDYFADRLLAKRHPTARLWIHRSLIGFESYSAEQHIRFGAGNMQIKPSPNAAVSH